MKFFITILIATFLAGCSTQPPLALGQTEQGRQNELKAMELMKRYPIGSGGVSREFIERIVVHEPDPLFGPLLAYAPKKWGAVVKAYKQCQQNDANIHYQMERDNRRHAGPPIGPGSAGIGGIGLQMPAWRENREDVSTGCSTYRVVEYYQAWSKQNQPGGGNEQFVK